MGRKKSEIEEEIYRIYKRNHGKLSERHRQEIRKQIKSIDTRFYEQLVEYDRKTGYTNKSAEYVNIMLKHYRKKMGENEKDYKARVTTAKNKLLKNYGIDTNYRKTKMLSFKGFGKGLGIRKITVPNKSVVTSNMKKVRTTALKSPKKFLGKVVDNLKPSKKRIHLSTPKGFFNKLKTWKENNPTKFKKYRIRALIAAALVSLSIGAATINDYIQNVEQAPIEHTVDYDATSEYDDIELEEAEPESNEINEVEMETEISEESTVLEETENETEGSTVQEQTENETEGPAVQEQTENETESSGVQEQTENEEEKEVETEPTNSVNESTVALSTLAHSLILDSTIDFNTEFEISDGLYYETPDETGNYGNYSKFSGQKLKLTYIDAIYEDGRYVTYNSNCGLSISDIIAQNEGAQISYHVVTTSGNILRMECIYIK